MYSFQLWLDAGPACQRHPVNISSAPRIKESGFLTHLLWPHSFRRHIMTWSVGLLPTDDFLMINPCAEITSFLIVLGLRFDKSNIQSCNIRIATLAEYVQTKYGSSKMFTRTNDLLTNRFVDSCIFSTDGEAYCLTTKELVVCIVFFCPYLSIYLVYLYNSAVQNQEAVSP